MKYFPVIALSLLYSASFAQRPELTYQLGQSQIKDLAITHDGEYLVSSTASEVSNNITIWEMKSRRQVKTIDTGIANRSMVVDTVHNQILVAVFEYVKGEEIKMPSKEEFQKMSIEERIKIQTKVRASKNGYLPGIVKFYDLKTGNLIKTKQYHPQLINDMAISPDGKYLAIVTGGLLARGSSENPDAGVIRIIDLSTDQVVMETEPPLGKNGLIFSRDANDAVAVAFRPDAKEIAVGFVNGMIKTFSVSDPKPRYEFTKHTAKITDLAYSRDGKLLVSGGGITKYWKGVETEKVIDNLICIWNDDNGRLIKSMQGHKFSVLSLAFETNDQYFVSGGDDNQIRVWDRSGRSIAVMNPERMPIGVMVFDPGTHHLISAGYQPSAMDGYSKEELVSLVSQYNTTIRFWDMDRKVRVDSITGNFDYTSQILLSPHEKYIASANSSRVKILDAEKGEVLGYLLGNTTRVEGVVFSPDDKFAVTKDWNGMLRCYDLSLMKELWSYESKDWGVVFDISHDSKTLLVNSKYEMTELPIIYSIDMETGKVRNTRIKSKNFTDLIVYSTTSPIVALMQVPRPQNENDIFRKPPPHTVELFDTESGQLIRTLDGDIKYSNHEAAFSNDGNYLALSDQKGKAEVYDTRSGKVISIPREAKELEISTSTTENYIHFLAFSPDSKLLALATKNRLEVWELAGITKVFEIKEGELGDKINSLSFTRDGNYLAFSTLTMTFLSTHDWKKGLEYYFPKGNRGFVSVMPSGLFDGKEEDMASMLHYVVDNKAIPLESFFEKFYTPRLNTRFFAGEKFNVPEMSMEQSLKLPPLVIFQSHPDGEVTGQKTFSVSVKTKDMGGGIDEVRLYQNRKLIESRKVSGGDKEVTLEFTLNLVPDLDGLNFIKAVAYNADRTESLPATATVTYTGKSGDDPVLYLIVVGINEYRNPRYNLNYAVTDASAFRDVIMKEAQPIFKEIRPVFIQDSEATKEGIVNVLTGIAIAAKEQDMLIFYYAGHGAMSEGINFESEYFLIPHEVTKIYGAEEALRENALSAEQIRGLSQQINAQKQVFIIDACQSGGALEAFASRGAAEEKAIAQLARSTGTYWIAASGSEQFATEFKDLGHGVFTYALLEGLKGGAEGGEGDGRITVKELSAFIETRVPELSEQYKGKPQFPTGFGYGNDFPVVIVK